MPITRAQLKARITSTVSGSNTAASTSSTLTDEDPIEPNQLSSSTIPLRELPSHESTISEVASAEGPFSCDDRYDISSQLSSEGNNKKMAFTEDIDTSYPYLQQANCNKDQQPHKLQQEDFTSLNHEGVQAQEHDLEATSKRSNPQKTPSRPLRARKLMLMVRHSESTFIQAAVNRRFRSHQPQLDHTHKNDELKIPIKHKSETDPIDKDHKARLGFAQSSKKVRAAHGSQSKAGSSQENVIIIEDEPIEEEPTEEPDPILERAETCLRAMITNIRRNQDSLKELDSMSTPTTEDEEALEMLVYIAPLKWKSFLFRPKTMKLLGLA